MLWQKRFITAKARCIKGPEDLVGRSYNSSKTRMVCQVPGLPAQHVWISVISKASNMLGSELLCEKYRRWEYIFQILLFSES